MATTLRHALPLLSSGQAQKEITHNEALLLVDRLLHLAIVTRSLTAPPSAPAAGSAYIVPAGATGAWSGQANAIAGFDGFGWSFTTPVAGTLAFISDENCIAIFTTAWSDGAWPARSLRIDGRAMLAAAPVAVAAPVGGTVVDSQSRTAINGLIAALQAQGLLL